MRWGRAGHYLGISVSHFLLSASLFPSFGYYFHVVVVVVFVLCLLLGGSVAKTTFLYKGIFFYFREPLFWQLGLGSVSLSLAVYVCYTARSSFLLPAKTWTEALLERKQVTAFHLTNAISWCGDYKYVCQDNALWSRHWKGRDWHHITFKFNICYILMKQEKKTQQC